MTGKTRVGAAALVLILLVASGVVGGGYYLYQLNMAAKDKLRQKKIMYNDIAFRFDVDLNFDDGILREDYPEEPETTIAPGWHTEMRIQNYNLWVEWKCADLREKGGSDDLKIIESIGNQGIIGFDDLFAVPETLVALWSGKEDKERGIARGYFIMSLQEQRLVFENSLRPLTMKDFEEFEENPELKLYDLSIEARSRSTI